MSRSTKKTTTKAAQKPVEKPVEEVETAVDVSAETTSVETKSMEEKPKKQTKAKAEAKAPAKQKASATNSATESAAEKPKAVKGTTKAKSEKASTTKSTESAEEKPKKTPGPRAARTKPTPFQVKADLEKLLELLEKEIDTRKINRDENKNSGTRPLSAMKKILKKAISDTGRLPSRKAVKAQNEQQGIKSTKVSGFSLPCKISPELRTFMELDANTNPIREEITDAVCCYIKYDPNEKREKMKKWAHLNTNNRNLQDPSDKMKIIPDDKLAKLLNYADYVKSIKEGKVTKFVKNENGTRMKVVSDDASLRYCTVQKLIQAHVLECIKPPVAPKPTATTTEED